MFIFHQPGDLPIAYLCGQEPFCRIVSWLSICTPVFKFCLKYCMLVIDSIAKVGNRAALALAKKNIEGFYPVVGVLEKLGL